MNIYLSADKIGTPTGGGAVTYHEYKAFSSMGAETHPLDGARIPFTDPFSTDNEFAKLIGSASGVKLAHIYAGCFTNTVEALKKAGAKVTYTAAAHDINESRREFEELGIPFNFPHLTQPDLWEKYVGGYKAADLVICPSTLSKKVMESYGCKKVIVIPHGCDIPKEIAPLPKRFTVGFLGSAGPDKSVRYLLEAWKKLGVKDAVLLIAGNNIDQVLPLWRRFGGGNVEFMGFVKDVSDFYNKISIYVQPSVTEGFGIEVAESLAHARPVVCSIGAGASDIVSADCGITVAARNVDMIAEAIEWYRSHPRESSEHGIYGRGKMADFTWDRIREKYTSAWQKLIA